MFNVTTKYDKIGDVRKKVFIIRGDEAYAKTVDVVLTYVRGNRTGDNISGFPITLTGTVYRNIGDSEMVFYDGDEPIDSIATHDWQSTYNLPARLSWGADHKLSVQYKSNKQTMGKKSKSITLHEAIPSDYIPTITFTSSSQISANASYTVTGRVQFLGENVSNGTDIVISLDDEVVDTVTTTNGVFSCSLGNIPLGQHKVTAETLQSETMNAKAQDLILNSGYEVTFIEYPSTIITGVPKTFKVSVKNFNGDGVAGATVNFNGQNYTANSQGIATFTLSSIATGSYRASYGGAYTDYVNIKSITLPDIYINSTGRLVDQRSSLPIDISVPDGGGLDVDVFEDEEPVTTLTLDKNGTGTYTYSPTGRGKVAIRFSTLNLSQTVNIIDCKSMFLSEPDGIRQAGTQNLRILNNGVTTFTSSRILKMDFNNNATVQFDSIVGQSKGNVFDVTFGDMDRNTHNFTIKYGGKTMLETGENDFRYKNIKLKYENGTCYLYVQGTLRVSGSVEAPTTSNPTWSIQAHDAYRGNSKMEISKLLIYEE